MNGLKLNFLLSKKPFTLDMRLVREVAADHALVGDGIVGLADLRQQQELHVEDRRRPTGSRDRRAAPIPRPLVSTKVTPVARLPERSSVDAHHLGIVAQR